MKPAQTRSWIAAAVLTAGCGMLLLSARQQTLPLREPLAGLPREMLGYQGKDIVIDSAQQAVAGMSTYTMRAFEGGSGPPFQIYVGYYESQIQGKTIHSPKNCLPGAGWEPISAGTMSIGLTRDTVTVNRYVLGNQSFTALVYYWYQGRGRVASNEYLVKWNLLKDKALRGRSEEALVRIVVPYSGPVAGADSLAIRVAQNLIQQVERRLPVFPGRSVL